MIPNQEPESVTRIQSDSGTHRIWLIAALSAVVFLACFRSSVPAGHPKPDPQYRDQVLNELRDAVTRRYGFLNGGARINQGPCAAFATLFFEEWDRRFTDPVSLWVVMSADGSNAIHAMVRLPDGSAYDGGRGVMSPELVRRLLLTDTLRELKQPDRKRFEEYFGPLDRNYPRCPDFDLPATRSLISQYLDRLLHHGS